jgi:TPR repeat protein
MKSSESLRSNLEKALGAQKSANPEGGDRKSVDDYIETAIRCHEANQLEESFQLLQKAADAGSPLGLFLLGISVRHGWGCQQDQQLAFRYLKRSACSSFAHLNVKNTETLRSSVAKGELVLAIYEIGVCYSHGWGVAKHKEAAAFYFHIAADLGYAEAQSELAFCYQHGHGVKKDVYKAAKYYRMAYAQGIEPVGNSWIFKEKYDNVV